MRNALKMIASAGSLAAAGTAFACGVCIEDKVAATYDHEVVRSAVATQGQVIFVALEGRDSALVGARIMSATGVPGMRNASVRYAVSPPAFSFALAKGAAPEKAMAAFERATAGTNLRMRIVRIMRDGVLVDPPT